MVVSYGKHVCSHCPEKIELMHAHTVAPSSFSICLVRMFFPCRFVSEDLHLAFMHDISLGFSMRVPEKNSCYAATLRILC